MYHIQLLKIEDIDLILPFLVQLNPEEEVDQMRQRQMEMFGIETYQCFGFYEDEHLLGISSGWITVRIYSGKQLEIDNVIIANSQQSKGYGALFLDEIEKWAKQENCLSIELNTYVQNSRSHKFYFNRGFKILGFHFIKKIH